MQFEDKDHEYEPARLVREWLAGWDADGNDNAMPTRTETHKKSIAKQGRQLEYILSAVGP